MSFEDLPPLTHSAKQIDPDVITMTSRPAPSGGGTVLVLAIGVAATQRLASHLGLTNGGGLVAAQWGTGVDDGKLRLTPADDQGWKFRIQKNGIAKIHIGRQPSRFKGKIYKAPGVNLRFEPLEEIKSARPMVIIHLPKGFYE